MDRNDDKLELLQIKTERMVVGDQTLQLKTTTLAQQKALSGALTALNPDNLLAALKPVMDAIESDGLAAGIAAHGAAVYKALAEYLTVAGGGALAEAVGVLLDNEDNFKTIRDAHFIEDAAERSASRYLRSPALRDYIAEVVTIPQAIEIVKIAVSLNGYGAMGKAVMAWVGKAINKANSAIVTPQPTNVRPIRPTPEPEPSPSTQDENSMPSEHLMEAMEKPTIQ